MEGLEAAFSKGNLKCDPGMNTLIKRVGDNGILLGALGCLSRETLDKLIRTVGWEERNIHVVPCSGAEKVFPTADAWLKLAKSMAVRSTRCVVLTTSQTSCKAALSAGMKCVVVSDEYSAFQDFGGADYVADGMGKAVVDQLLELLDLD